MVTGFDSPTAKAAGHPPLAWISPCGCRPAAILTGHPMTVLLTCQDVRVEFGELVALRDVTFELSGGQLLGLVGPNGAGKTTLLRVLGGLHAPTRGAAHILGKPVLGEHEVVRSHVGFAPEAPPAYDDLTIEQFLRFIAGAYSLDADATAERIDFWLEQLWLTEKRDTLIKNLSRGMRQRVTLARAFLPRPHIILLDEPLGGLDPAGRLALRRVLSMLRDQGCAMIVSSHILVDLEEVATHIAIIERGTIRRWCDTEELVRHDGKSRTYRLSMVKGLENGQQVLAEIDGVSDLRTAGGALEFEFDADEHAAAKLLRRLVNAGVPVLSFTAVKATLEDAYLRSGLKQVD